MLPILVVDKILRLAISARIPHGVIYPERYHACLMTLPYTAIPSTTRAVLRQVPSFSVQVASLAVLRAWAAVGEKQDMCIPDSTLVIAATTGATEILAFWKHHGQFRANSVQVVAAAQHGHISVLDWLWENAPALFTGEDQTAAIDNAASVNVLNWFLAKHQSHDVAFAFCDLLRNALLAGRTATCQWWAEHTLPGQPLAACRVAKVDGSEPAQLAFHDLVTMSAGGHLDTLRWWASAVDAGTVPFLSPEELALVVADKDYYVHHCKAVPWLHPGIELLEWWSDMHAARGLPVLCPPEALAYTSMQGNAEQLIWWSTVAVPRCGVQVAMPLFIPLKDRPHEVAAWWIQFCADTEQPVPPFGWFAAPEDPVVLDWWYALPTSIRSTRVSIVPPRVESLPRTVAALEWFATHPVDGSSVSPSDVMRSAVAHTNLEALEWVRGQCDLLLDIPDRFWPLWSLNKPEHLPILGWMARHGIAQRADTSGLLGNSIKALVGGDGTALDLSKFWARIILTKADAANDQEQEALAPAKAFEAAVASVLQHMAWQPINPLPILDWLYATMTEHGMAFFVSTTDLLYVMGDDPTGPQMDLVVEWVAHKHVHDGLPLPDCRVHDQRLHQMMATAVRGAGLLTLK
ncbi:hypothetical protein BC828DRAFT_384871 [Blastocladiella britannica]|nr:hypothetical protein BC828DRAFT_384871 [Blastocladiella britannica]